MAAFECIYEYRMMEMDGVWENKSKKLKMSINKNI